MLHLPRQSFVDSIIDSAVNSSMLEGANLTKEDVVLAMYRVVFLTGPPDFQYQNEKTCSANEELSYIENFVKN